MAEFFQSISPNTYMTLSLIVFSVTLLMRSRHYFKKSKTRTELTPKEAEAVKVPPGKSPQVVTVRSEGRGVPQRIVKTVETPQPFAGATVPSEVSRWEVEIHELGRQTLAQIDTKLIALQTLATEVNQVGHRVELMIEHLENLLKAPRPAASAPIPAETAASREETGVPQYHENKRDVANRSSVEPDAFETKTDLFQKTHGEQAHQKILSAGSLAQEAFSPLGDLLEEFEREKQAWEEAETLERTSMAGAMQPMDMSRVVNGKMVSDSTPARILEPHPSHSPGPVLPTALPEIEKELPLPHIPLSDETSESETEPDFSALETRPSRLARRFLAEDTAPLPQQFTTPGAVSPYVMPPGEVSPRTSPTGPTLSFNRSSVYDAPASRTSAPQPRLQPHQSTPISPMFPQPVGHQVPTSSPAQLRFSSQTEPRGSGESQVGAAISTATVSEKAALGSSRDNEPGGKAPQFSSLFEQGKQKPNIIAGPREPALSAPGESPASPGLADREENLDLRQQIFLLSDYGYKAKEIAAQLSRPVGEIEFVLNLRSTGSPSASSTKPPKQRSS